MNRRRSRWARWFGPSPARAAAGLVLACLVALTACTGDGTDSNADSSSASPSGAVAEAHGAPDLEELLPDELDGLVLTTASYRGDAVTEVVGFDSTMLEAMLADVGATMDDLSLAVAGDEAGTVLVAAIRVDGVPG